MLTFDLARKKKLAPNKAVPGSFAYISTAQGTILRKAVRGEPDASSIPVGSANDKYEQEADRVAGQVMRRPDPSASQSLEPILQRKSNCACGGSCPKCQAGQALIQPKLTIGSSNDKYEQEADRVAEQVMRMPDPALQRQVNPEEDDEEVLQTKPMVQRQTEEDDEEDVLQTKPLVQRRGGGGNAGGGEAPTIVNDVLQSPGRPLDAGTRHFMEPRLGHDFSQVRVHTDAKAAESARAVNARAFTLGNNIVFGNGQYSPGSTSNRHLIAHELTHVMQQGRKRKFQAIQRKENDAPSKPFPEKEADASNDYPHEVALFSSFLLRGRYIEEVAALLPSTWRSMSQAELTAWLTKNFTEEQLQARFLEKYRMRAEIKARFRKLNIVMALVIGLIWARENIAEGDWGTAAAKVGGSGFAAWAFNRILFARDSAPAGLMKSKGKAFGRWFKGAARTNKFVNFLVRRVGGAFLLWDLKNVLMSGGYGGPNIPFDLIVHIDIDDPSTWKEPDQTLLDFGFNIWYQQNCTSNHPEACGSTPIYLGKIEGSAVKGLFKLLDIAPHEVKSLRKKLFRVEGVWDKTDLLIVSIVHKRILASENILVMATGEQSGEKISGRGHFRTLKVVPANEAAVNLFQGDKSRWVPEYLLKPFN